jgi:hypothetical protein
MAERGHGDRARARFERVYVELDWYDGPRSGLADVNGVPHYFQAVHDDSRPGAPDDVYHVWPASDDALALEREQWAIFVAWNSRYEAGTAATDTHPGLGGIDARYDELTALLTRQRAVSPGARRLAAEWRQAERATLSVAMRKSPCVAKSESSLVAR